MQLYSRNTSSTLREKHIYALCLLLLLILIFPTGHAVKNYLIDKGFMSHHTETQDKALQLAKSIALAPTHWYLSNKDLPIIKVDIKYQAWLKLKDDRQTAMNHGFIPDVRNEVSAVIYHGANKISAKVRLQGDMLDHINKANRWSLKVTLGKKQAIFESRRFALVAPSVRLNQGSSLFAQSMRLADFDIISPKHIPVKVVLNGEDWGVMLFEQGFSQDLLAVNNRTEGLIIRLDMHAETTNERGQIHRVLKPRVLQRKTVLGNHSLSNQRQLSLALLNEFLDGRRAASDVFDAKRLGQYLATVDLWGAWHALTWNNWRWYYNPHTAKLEPIQSDVAVTPASHIWLMRPPSHTFELSNTMLSDPQVRAHYEEAKETLMSKLHSTLIPNLKTFEANFNQQLHSDSPLLTAFDYSIMERQADCWHMEYQTAECQSISHMDPNLHRQMDSFTAIPNWDLISRLSSHGGKKVWTVINNDQQPLLIKGIEGITRYDEINPLDELNDELPIKIMPNQQTAFTLPSSMESINVFAALEGKKVAKFQFVNNIKLLTFVPRPSPSTTSAFPYDQFIDRAKGQWQFKPGKWSINTYLVTPENTKVIIPAGTELNFSKKAGLMVFGSLDVNGTNEHPVIMTKTESATKWSGLAVLSKNKETTHSISHLKISFASSPKLGLWQPRGAIYFVNGFVQMQSVDITDNQSEDGLNIVNAHVLIRGLNIKNALSDAFDCDFCTGELTNSRFYNIGFRSGGDGLDVSGSTLALADVTFEKVRDKAISAGERSQLTIKNAAFNDVNFGIVAKDASSVEAKNVTASNVQYKALMSYSKKRIFGSASLNVSHYQCSDTGCDEKNVAELGSQLVVNGIEIQQQKLDVKKMYNTVMKSDKPR
ncbi:hypothetical protein L4C54_01640 [Vibrio lamellibrachiae]|uniref:hypothetical protein n=1 Tax=Vibrio lamellibrachiae TaxID=2910253 RepID=UPI003D14743C